MCLKNFVLYHCFSELLVDFDHEHRVWGDFKCLHPRQNLLDAVSIYFIHINLLLHYILELLLNLLCTMGDKSRSIEA